MTLALQVAHLHQDIEHSSRVGYCHFWLFGIYGFEDKVFGKAIWQYTPDPIRVQLKGSPERTSQKITSHSKVTFDKNILVQALCRFIFLLKKVQSFNTVEIETM